VLHLFPHWNYNKGDTVDVWAYYNNAEEVELFVNGRSLGSKSKTNDVLHIMWRVPYEPGVIKAISKKNGKTILTKEVRTSGAPVKIQLIADRTKIKANGTDLSFITVKLLDKNGNPVPNDDRLIEFSVTGTGYLAGTDNGFPADSISLKNHSRKTWNGLALAIIQSQKKKGNITVTAKSAGLEMSVISLRSE
jgi:beta-galactosidase